MIYSSFAKAYKRLDYHQNILALHIKIKNNFKKSKMTEEKGGCTYVHSCEKF